MPFELTIPRLILSLILTLALAALAGGCGCTDAGCGHALSIEVQGTWSPGQYEVVFDLAGRSESCTVTVDDSIERAALLPTCSGGLLGWVSNDRPALFSVPSTSADRVNVRILRDGVELSAAELRPSYVEHQPNGAFCDPTCRSARVGLSLPS